ncbi:NADH-cytochrome b5 reductase-like [Spea bombifrons]|uniref:NADH-cytochrome b5 reductase-like n=1 Tax=Spea bombifrons TaxID=233779 RepID=UPI002349FD62|nr:NADH-cytochrome b5 reductase-like [Spea bombifrons]
MDDVDWLSLRPVEPSPAQCCGSGCSPCIYDIYQADLSRWEKAKEAGDAELLNRRKSETNDLFLSAGSFTAFELLLVERETEDTNRYRFKIPNGSSLGHTLGQHVILRGTVNGMEVQRAYTPINRVDTKGYFEVLIKLYKHGLMSQYIKNWKAGDWIEWRGAFGGFSYKPNQYGELLMVCSGTGIAPMLPILSCVTDNEEDETFITLVICCRTFENIYMKGCLREQARFWNVRMFYVLSQEQSLLNLPLSYRENTKLGRIDSIFVAEVLGTCRREPYVLICGSLTFNEHVNEIVKLLKIKDSSIFIF